MARLSDRPRVAAYVGELLPHLMDDKVPLLAGETEIWDARMTKRIVKFDGGKITQMARADGYVMCRRPHCMPFIMSASDFDILPDYSKEAEARHRELEVQLKAMARMPVKGW